MNNPIPGIVIWVLLGSVVLAYVIYRLVTDRRNDSKQNALYPLVSNRSDGMFPQKDDVLGWVGYLLMVLGMVGFVGIVYIETTGESAAGYLVNFVGVSIVAGLLLLGLSKLKKRWDR